MSPQERATFVAMLRGHDSHGGRWEEVFGGFAADQIEADGEAVHYANGVADLAMKHRDEAEARAEALAQQVATLRGGRRSPSPSVIAN